MANDHNNDHDGRPCNDVADKEEECNEYDEDDGEEKDDGDDEDNGDDGDEEDDKHIGYEENEEEEKDECGEEMQLDEEKDEESCNIEETREALLTTKKRKETSCSFNDETSKIKYKRLAKTHEPNFYNMCYCVKPCDTENVPTFHVTDFYKCYNLSNQTEEFFCCIIHGPQIIATEDCLHCKLFPQFNYTFIIETRFRFYPFVQATFYLSKNFNYFRSFINYGARNLKLKIKSIINEGSKTELRYYHSFMGDEFKGGELKLTMAGKKSFIRNKMLGFQTLGLRLTLTIDCQLGPNYISIPKNIYDELDLATPYVIVNRAPSINAKCIYVAEALVNCNEKDATIHISPFFTDGLHADQDGDDLTIFYLKRVGEIPSLTMEAAITELRNMSWKYGSRHDTLYRSRYKFTQYHQYILHVYDEFFKKHSALWTMLRGTPKEKCVTVMELGCSILHDEVDDFINLIIEFTSKLGCVLTTSRDMLTGLGAMKAVVDSGAKGSDEHIKIYLDNLYDCDPKYDSKLIAGFDKYVDASTNVSVGGARQFTLLYGTNSLYIHNNNIYSNNTIILRNIADSQLTSGMFYNKHAIDYVNDALLADDEV